MKCSECSFELLCEKRKEYKNTKGLPLLEGDMNCGIRKELIKKIIKVPKKIDKDVIEKPVETKMRKKKNIDRKPEPGREDMRIMARIRMSDYNKLVEYANSKDIKMALLFRIIVKQAMKDTSKYDEILDYLN